MESFRLEDVRDSFREDVLACIGRIEEVSRMVAGLSPATEAASAAAPAFERFAAQTHAIRGTAGLVSVGSLEETAARLESLAERGRISMDIILAHAKRASQIAALCIEGAREMRSMLDMALDGRDDEAEWAAADFAGRLADVERQLSVRPPPPPERFYQEPQDALEPPSAPEASAPAPALTLSSAPGGVFAGLGSITAPPPPVPSPSERPPRPSAAPADGSSRAATRGDDVSAPSIPAPPDDGDPLAGFDFIDEPRTAVLPLPASAGELAAVFRVEAEAASVTAVGYFAALASDPHDRDSLSKLGDTFHQLKGAAASVGLHEAGAAASLLLEQVHDLSGHAEVTEDTVTALVRGTNHLLRLAGAPEIIVPSARPSRAPAPVQSAPPPAADEDEWIDVEPEEEAVTVAPPAAPAATFSVSDELKAIFRQEVIGLIPTVERCLAELAQHPAAIQPAQELRRVFHMLKGSAATAELPEISETCRTTVKLLDVRTASGAIDREALEGITEDINRILAALSFGGEIALPAPSASAATASAPDVAAFAFDGGDEGEQAPIEDELVAIFRREAREAALALRGHLATLARLREDVVAAEHVERLFHTLKGAAATVGLREVSAMAAGLQARMEAVVERREAADDAFLAAIQDGTSKLLHAAGLPPLASGPIASPPTNESVGAKALFLEEAERILVRLVEPTPPEADPEVAERRRTLLHRLKGSALVVGEGAVGAIATRLHQGSQDGSLAAAELRRGVEEIARILGFTLPDAEPAAAPPPAAAAPAPAEPRRDPVEIPEGEELWDAFVQECSELLFGLEKAVFSLEETDQPKEALREVYRLTHTLKGAVNTVGLAPVGRELHLAEDFLDTLVGAPILPPMKGVSSLLIDVIVGVRRNLKEASRGHVETSPTKLAARIREIVSAARVAVGEITGGGVLSRAPETGATGASEQSARGILDSADESYGRSALESAEPSYGRAVGDSVDADARVAADTGDHRKFVRVPARRLDQLMNLAGELVVSRSRMIARVGSIRALQRDLGRSRARLIERVEAFRDQYEFANLDGRALGRTPANDVERAPADAAFGALEMDRYDDIHVLSRALGEIGSDFGEIFRQLTAEIGEFEEQSEALGATVTGIQSEVTRARMVPLDLLFTRLRLPIRDAAARERKEVKVVVTGEGVTLDKTIADALFAPMLHLVRNAVVHGLERPDQRAAAGKDRAGTVTLAARQESGQIVVEVKDDGAGLDLKALHARGVAMGVIPPETPPDAAIVRDLVFGAGISTKATADDVAGRGMGGDIVRRAVERLNGDIRVDTKAGQGTTFVVTLPLTLAITRALVVRHGAASYAVPLYFAERILDAEGAVISASGASRWVRVEDAFVPLRHLGDVLAGGGSGDAAAAGPILVLRVGDHRTALQVDEVVVQEEIVVKTMGELLEGHAVFAGVTIRGTGDIVLILDVPGLMAGRAARVEAARPLALAAGDAASAASADQGGADVQEEAVPPSQRAKKALFVDDSLSVRKVAEQMLSRLGYDVTVAVDGVDGLAKLRESSFDVVLTDLEMPRMHGYDFIRELRFVPAYRDLPVIVVTSRSGQKHQEKARQAGATDYLTKPFNSQTLEEALHRRGPKEDR